MFGSVFVMMILIVMLIVFVVVEVSWSHFD